MTSERENNDLVVLLSEYAYILDKTDGNVGIKAMSPELALAIKTFSEHSLGKEMIGEFGILAKLEGKSIPEIIALLGNGTPGMENLLKALPHKVEVIQTEATELE